MMTPQRTIGITLRNSPANGYDEDRDALARDWFTLFVTLGWHTNWILLPNLGTNTASYAIDRGVNALILSGGDDLGNDLLRDSSEFALLETASAFSWPVLGVCRGMQMIQCFAGGQVEPLDPNVHVANLHPILIGNKRLPWAPEVTELNVNSFHQKGVKSPASALEPLAWASECCEAFCHRQLPWVGVMWHPERDAELMAENRALFKWLFERG